uniref:GST N-terminal domain-containing protein n=1 Tax=Chromera velia CCMP2878 TaxID=1169474 RepID=A0A0G4HFA1_9ALVE|eukprot:Cvel_26886.t1-p1 / transcript=Cvel_26886.t1 / gene=Cvel_26886 / organism=Chromera_velia_CCMP2878 / gene_product=Protein IN2-1 homolog B, putative / transcript_product=Protein IN2-1 homolog B, putative / location=Cvel_scaffold3269:1016-2262(-) / protein_length=313 / sequence_SO=supercontig / SO=protein_coding / is_pseudo=false
MRSLGTFLVTFLNLGLLRCSAFLTGRIAAAGSILSPTDQDRRRGGDRGAVSFLPAQSDPSSLTQTESGKAMKEGTGVETWVPGDPLLLKFFASDYCPYCHRVWLLLVHQKVSFERHLIDLASESKPPFFLEINPEGKVPTVLAHPVDDQTPEVHVESLDILRWISRETGFDKDLTEEEKQRVEDILSDWQLIEDVTWNLMCENNGRACEKLQRKNCSETLYDFDRKVARFQKEGKGGRFLAGTLQPSLADFAFWPLFERMIPVLSSVKKYEIFGQKGYRYPRPVLKAWAVAMGELEAVKAVRLPDSNYVQLHQ